MCFDISKDGDELEKQYATFICENIPYYAKIWSIFIGNDGTSHIAQMEGTTEEDNKVRQNIGEIHYSILESLISIKRIYERYNSANPVQINCNDELILFMTRIGNVGDLIKQSKKQFKIETEDILDTSYQKRNSIIHGRRIPYALTKSGELEIPEISSAKNINELKASTNVSTWYDREYKKKFEHTVWTDFPGLKKVAIKDFFKKTFDELLPKVNNEFYDIYKEVYKYCEDNKLTILKNSIKKACKNEHYSISNNNNNSNGYSGCNENTHNPNNTISGYSGCNP